MMPAFIAVFIGYYAVARAFGIEMPFIKFMVLIPYVLVISNLPVAFGGYGTTTFAWVVFFSDYATEEQIATITLFIPTARVVIRAVIGMLCLPFALKDLYNLPEKKAEAQE